MLSDIGFPIRGNCREILGSCLFVQFFLFEDVFQVKGDIVRGTIEKPSHEFLAKPNGVILNPYLNAVFSGLKRKNEKFGGSRTRRLGFLHSASSSKKRGCFFGGFFAMGKFSICKL
jgi:hypothetical protein